MSSLFPSICLSGSFKFDGSEAAPEENLSGFVQADRGVAAHAFDHVWLFYWTEAEKAETGHRDWWRNRYTAKCSLYRTLTEG